MGTTDSVERGIAAMQFAMIDLEGAKHSLSNEALATHICLVANICEGE